MSSVSRADFWCGATIRPRRYELRPAFSRSATILHCSLVVVGSKVDIHQRGEDHPGAALGPRGRGDQERLTQCCVCMYVQRESRNFVTSFSLFSTAASSPSLSHIFVAFVGRRKNSSSYGVGQRSVALFIDTPCIYCVSYCTDRGADPLKKKKKKKTHKNKYIFKLLAAK